MSLAAGEAPLRAVNANLNISTGPLHFSLLTHRLILLIRTMSGLSSLSNSTLLTSYVRSVSAARRAAATLEPDNGAVADCVANLLRILANMGRLSGIETTLAPVVGQPQDFCRGQLLETVLHMVLASQGQRPASISSAIYPFSLDPDQARNRQLRHCLSGRDTPRLSNLKQLAIDVVARLPDISAHAKERMQARVFTELLIARALEYCAYNAPDDVNFISCVRSRLTNSEPLDIGLIISTLNHLEGKKMGAPLDLAGLEAIQALSFDFNKEGIDRPRCLALTDAFANLCEAARTPASTEYMLAWSRARLDLWDGDFARAHLHYEHAVRCALYNAGSTQKRIMAEAIYVAACLRKKPAIKRLLRTAQLLGYFRRWLYRDVGTWSNDPAGLAERIALRFLPHAPRRLTQAPDRCNPKLGKVSSA